MAFFSVVVPLFLNRRDWKNTKSDSYSGLTYSTMDAIGPPAMFWRTRVGSLLLVFLTVSETDVTISLLDLHL